MPERGEQQFFGRRLRIASTFMCLSIGLLLVRLWYLQCVYGSYYRDLSENNRIRTIRTVPPRGTVYDRNEQVLVRNRPAFNVALMLEDTPNVDAALSDLAAITGRELETLKRQLSSGSRARHFEPQVAIFDVSHEELAKIRVNSYRLPGVIVQAVPARAYPHGQLASQVLGYSREISKAQLESMPSSLGYRNGDLFGQSGIEKQWEEYLRGRSGYVQVEVDARGNRRGELGIVNDQIGDDLILTLDADLQAKAEEALGAKRGAVVALDPNNGEVLALASGPTFDANMFSGRMDAAQWQSLVTDSQKPLTNRAISSKYPPGSTFKLFMAAAGLAAKKITPHTTVNCPGFYTIYGRPYRCHKRSGHGPVDLAKAMTVSCNAYFYHLGQQLQIEGITKYVGTFGFGAQTGIQLQGEDPGILPSDEWKRAVHDEKWYPGDTVPVSIGQGYMNVTPLQMAVAVSAIANGGSVYRPLLLKKIIDHEHGDVIEFEPKKLHDVAISKEILDIVRGLAIQVVNGERGTGKRAALPGVVVAGKTGTAQVGVLGKESLGERFKDHAWFVSFAPAENPLIAMAVIVENSGHGGEFAAPISREVMEVFFRKKGMLPPDEPIPPAEEIPIPLEEGDSELDILDARGEDATVAAQAQPGEVSHTHDHMEGSHGISPH